MIRDLRSSLSTSAWKQYSKAWADFTHFCDTMLSTTHIPASTLTISLYVTHLHQTGLKHTTIRTILSSIAFQHKINDYPDPTKSFATQKLLLAYTRTDPPPTTRKPITQSILAHLLQVLKCSDNTSYDKRLYRALFSVMYHGALRISELCNSKTSNHTLSRQQLNIITFKKSQCLKIAFTSFKHSVPSPQPLLVHPTHRSTCPINSFTKYIKIRPKGKQNSPAFCRPDGHSISRAQVVNMLSSLLNVAGYTPKHYNTHSFRIGRATDLALQGFSHAQIALQGRWKSNAFLRYIKPNVVHSKE